MEKMIKMPKNFELFKQIAELTKQINFKELETEIETDEKDGGISDTEWEPFSGDNPKLFELRTYLAQYL